MNFIDIYELLFIKVFLQPGLGIFIMTFLFGDEIVYFFSFLSGQGFFNLKTVIFFSILGNGLCDIFWLSVAKFGILKRFKKIEKDFEIGEDKEKITDTKLLIKRISKRKIYLVLLISKFFYGTRLLALFYSVKKVKSFRKIVLLNTFAVITWVVVIAPLFWFVGSRVYFQIDSFMSIHKIIGIAVLFATLIYIINRIFITPTIRNWLKKRKRKI